MIAPSKKVSCIRTARWSWAVVSIASTVPQHSTAQQISSIISYVPFFVLTLPSSTANAADEGYKLAELLIQGIGRVDRPTR